MSEFSTRCQQLLTANNTTIYQISKQSDLERTALHRMVNGRQTPSQEFFDKFCKSIRISPKEQTELNELYLEEKIGRVKYQNRKYILELIEHLSEIEEVSIDPGYYAQNQDLFLSADNTPLTSYSENSFQTRMLLTTVLGITFRSKTKQSIITNIPSSFSFFMQDLYYFFQSYHNEVDIQHLLTFHSNPHGYKNVNCNLEIFREILPLALSSFQDYTPYYTYSQCLPADIDYLPLPYYLVTNDYVLALSSDMKTSILHGTKDIVSKYRRELVLLLKNMKPLIHCTRTAPDSLHFYETASLNSGWLSYSLESHPCLSSLLPKEYFSKLMTQALQASYPDASTLASVVKALTEHLQTILGHSPKTLFSFPGFIRFCQTGKVYGQIGTYFPAFSLSDRKKLLRNIISLNVNKCISWHLCKEEFTVPTYIHLELYHKKTFMFSKFKTDFNFRFAFIDESSIFEAFTDFFSSLEESGLIYSTEETNAIIQKHIDAL